MECRSPRHRWRWRRVEWIDRTESRNDGRNSTSVRNDVNLTARWSMSNLSSEQPHIIFFQQVGTFALTLMITSLASLYHDESIQIGEDEKHIERRLSAWLISDPPLNTNYISIFTRKSDVTKSNVSIVQHRSQWQMLKVEVRFSLSSNDPFWSPVFQRFSTKTSFISICSTRFSTKSRPKNFPHFVSIRSIKRLPTISSSVASAAR